MVIENANTKLSLLSQRLPAASHRVQAKEENAKATPTRLPFRTKAYPSAVLQ